MKKTIIPLLIATQFFKVFSFDWPQNEIMSDSFFSYFAQKRGGTISSSLVFSESETVKAADDGKIIVFITEHDEGDIFDSPLGNAIIISHKEKLETVYANLDSQNFPALSDEKEVSKGTPLGFTSNSGWQKGEACLEFQVIDTENENYVNPRILMPRIGKELPLTIKNVRAVNKKGETFYLDNQKKLASGVYLLYRDRQDVAMPYKTTITINGAASENLSYDVLSEKDGHLFIAGKRNYAVETVYPDDESQLLGEITLSKGKNTVTSIISDILGKKTQITYTIEAR